MRKLLILTLILCLALPCAAVMAESEAVAWTSVLPAMSERDLSMLVLANAAEPLGEDDVPASLINVIKRKDDASGRNANGGVYISTNGTVQLDRETANALTKLMEAAEAEGITLYLRQGYRSYKDQAKLVARARGSDSVQPAGACDYQTGLAVTLVSYEWRGRTLTQEFAQTKEARWMAENAARFGFILRYPEGKQGITGNLYEPWHLRYVGGSKVASTMQRLDLTLEEYVAKYRADLEEFLNRGGSLEDVLQSITLPVGPVVLETAGPDGDRELVIFHD